MRRTSSSPRPRMSTFAGAAAEGTRLFPSKVPQPAGDEIGELRTADRSGVAHEACKAAAVLWHRGDA